MPARQDHQSHLMRPWHNEWCGGTEPPTMLTFNGETGEVAVAIYASATDLHDGYVHPSQHTEQALIDPSREDVKALLPDRVAEYALRAAQVYVTQTQAII